MDEIHETLFHACDNYNAQVRRAEGGPDGPGIGGIINHL